MWGGELAPLSTKMGGFVLFAIHYGRAGHTGHRLQGLGNLGSFLFTSPWALLPGSMLDGVQERRTLTAGPDDWPPKKVSFLLSIIPGPCPASLPGGPVRMAFGPGGGPLKRGPFFYPYIGDCLGKVGFFGGSVCGGILSPLTSHPYPLWPFPKVRPKKKGPKLGPYFRCCCCLIVGLVPGLRLGGRLLCDSRRS
jgi:hypothetical protein